MVQKLGELRRRGARAKQLLSPSRYLDNPWVRLGAGVAVGFTLGLLRRGGGPPQHLLAGEVAPAAPRPVVGSLLRFGLSALARAAVDRVVTELQKHADSGK